MFLRKGCTNSMAGYFFYLDKCLLPIAPGKLQISIKNENRTIKLINEGQVNLLKMAGLTDIEFECTIPQVEYPFAVYPSGFRSAGYYLEYFEKLKTRQKPFQFIVTRMMPDGTPLFGTNIKVSMEDYRITEDAEDGFDLSVKVKLKQYRGYGTKSVSVKGAVTSSSGQNISVNTAYENENSKVISRNEINTMIEENAATVKAIADYFGVPMSQTRDLASQGKITSDIINKVTNNAVDSDVMYTVNVEQTRSQESAPDTGKIRYYKVHRENDTLFNIAKEVYGDGSKYSLLGASNKDAIIDPFNIEQGTVLKIPAV